MRILYHHRTLGDGAEGIHVAEMVKAFRALGHEVRVAALIGEATNVPTRATRRWARIARLLPGFAYELGEIAYNLRGYAGLAKAVRTFRPEIIYDRYVSYNYSAVAVGRRYGLPVFLEVNSPYSYQRQTFDERLYFRRLLRAFELRTCRDATRVIVVSTPLKRILVGLGVPAERIVVMPNGVDPERFRPDIDGAGVRARLGLDGKVVVGFTGILRPWHGLDLLVRAFGEVARRGDPLHLLIVGDGPSRAEVERLAAGLGVLDRLTITGRVPHDAVREYVAAMDIAVSPRATAYASPMKILEYMAMAKAVIAPDMDNIRDLLTDRQDALLFRPEDSSALADRIRRLAGDPTLRAALGVAARRKVERERSWSHNAAAVVRLAAECLRDRASAG